MGNRNIIFRLSKGDKIFLKDKNQELTVKETFIADNGSRKVIFKENEWTATFTEEPETIKNLKKDENLKAEII